MILASEDFEEVEVRQVGEFEPEYGFSSVKVVPDTGELIAIKVREVNGETKSLLTVFDLEGNFKLEPTPFFLISDELKFEGLEIW